MEPEREAASCMEQMLIVEKYETVVAYLYPIALYLKHGEHDRLARFIPSWLGHARWADTHHLLSWLETRYAIAC